MITIQAVFAFRLVFMRTVLSEGKTGKCVDSLSINILQQELGWSCDDDL